MTEDLAASRAGWDAAYAGSPPPWDIGRPQPAVIRLADEGAFRGRVLDAGCGTGENAIELASRGLETLGVDGARRAIEHAREKAARRGVNAEFLVADALDLTVLRRRFDSVLDCGLFHTFDDVDRERYVRSLGAVIEPGGDPASAVLQRSGAVGRWTSAHHAGRDPVSVRDWLEGRPDRTRAF